VASSNPSALSATLVLASSNPSALAPTLVLASSNPSALDPTLVVGSSNPSALAPTLVVGSSNPSALAPTLVVGSSNPSALDPTLVVGSSNPSALDPTLVADRALTAAFRGQRVDVGQTRQRFGVNASTFGPRGQRVDVFPWRILRYWRASCIVGQRRQRIQQGARVSALTTVRTLGALAAVPPRWTRPAAGPLAEPRVFVSRVISAAIPSCQKTRSTAPSSRLVTPDHRRTHRSNNGKTTVIQATLPSQVIHGDVLTVASGGQGANARFTFNAGSVSHRESGMSAT
jgi:hypothetical protein